MKIRRAKLSDYEELMKLYNEFVGEDRYSNYNFDSFEKVLNSDREFIFVAEESDKIIGFATLSVRNAVRYPRPMAQLDELFVLEEHRKHGVGKTLMKTIEEKAKNLNCINLFIESVYSRKAAHKFYESMGYENQGYHFKKTL